MTVKSTIKNIIDFVDKKHLTKIEEKRLLGNLSAVYNRLIKHDYQKYGYSENKFDVPDRVSEIFTELEFYCLIGKTWLKILSALNIKDKPQIVDLCPGFVPKIELGLFYLQYKGKVVAIDKDSRALSSHIKFMELFGPEFKISKKIINLFGRFKENYDVILANHLIDDLVLCYFSKKMKMKLSDIYAKEGNVKKIWEHVLENKKNNLEVMTKIIVKIFDQLSGSKGLICMTYYKSYLDKILDMDDAYKFNRELFKKIIKELKNKGFSEDKNIVKKTFENGKGHFGSDDCVVLRK
jgi:hypothetical protein